MNYNFKVVKVLCKNCNKLAERVSAKHVTRNCYRAKLLTNASERFIGWNCNHCRLKEEIPEISPGNVYDLAETMS